MTQQEKLFKPPVGHPEERKRLQKQALKILRMLEGGPVTNVEIQKIALSYTRRISDIREYLAPSGKTVKCSHIRPGVTEYRIVPL